MANKLEPIYQTGVKFYSSLTRDQALGKVAIGKDADGLDVFVEPGAICFVSDTDGNSIFLNKLLFGDGAVASGSTGGSGGTIVELKLENLQVTSEKTLADYFDNTTFTPDDIQIKDTYGNTVLTIDSGGILFGTSYYATLKYVTDQWNDLSVTLKTELEKSTKKLVNESLVSIYKVKGSIGSYTNLLDIADPQIGDVYNVTNSDINYVYTEEGWDPLGGSIDTSLFYKKTEIDKKIGDTLIDSLNYTKKAVEPIANRVSLAETHVRDLLSTVISHTTDISTNTTNISNIASLLTWL